MKILWNSLIRPHRDYCSQLWFPSNCMEQIREQETTLKSFSKKIVGLSKLHYWDNLKELKLYSCEMREEQNRIMYVLKILKGYVPNIGIELAPFNSILGRMIKIKLYKGEKMSVAMLKEFFSPLRGCNFSIVYQDLLGTTQGRKIALRIFFINFLNMFLITLLGLGVSSTGNG